MGVVGNLMTKQMLRNCIFLLFCCLLFACSTEPEQQTKEVPKAKIEVPIFNPDSAYYFVEKQVSFGPRVISSIPWKNCAIWLEKKFKTYTPNVLVQEAPITTYDGKKHTLKNIIASFSPEKNNRIALFAHWDSRHIADHDALNPEVQHACTFTDQLSQCGKDQWAGDANCCGPKASGEEDVNNFHGANPSPHETALA